MADEYVEREYEEVREKRTSSFSNAIKNISNWQFFAIMGLIVIAFLIIRSSKADKVQVIFLFVVIILFILFFSKKGEENKLISEDVAKRIACDRLEEKKELYHIPSDADITPTGFCRLQRRSGEPFEWHVGIKVATRNANIKYLRVDLEPYLGIITGIVDAPTGFKGDEKPDVVVVFPEHYMKE